MGKNKKAKGDPDPKQKYPLTGQVLMYTDFADTYDESRTRTVVEASNATLISSMVKDTDLHKPVLDIDLPVTLVPSSTPGHFHLFIDKEMSWEAYFQLLQALEAAGIIEHGYLMAAYRRQHTAVRLPWIHKGDKVDGN